MESIPDGSFNSYDFQLFHLVKSGSGLEILVCSYLSVKLHPSIRPILEKAFVPLVIENLKRGNCKGRVFFRTVSLHCTGGPHRQGIEYSYAKTMPQKGASRTAIQIRLARIHVRTSY